MRKVTFNPTEVTMDIDYDETHINNDMRSACNHIEDFNINCEQCLQILKEAKPWPGFYKVVFNQLATLFNGLSIKYSGSNEGYRSDYVKSLVLASAYLSHHRSAN